MARWLLRPLALAAALLATPAGAVTVDYFTSAHVFGDSLSDRGNVYRASRGHIPESPPYWKGRFSNGRVWSEHVAAEFRAAGLPTGIHAWGGAKARGGAMDLGQQVSRYRLIDRDRRGSRPLLALWAGGNDLRAKVGDTSRAGMRRVGRRAANAVANAAISLSRTGAEHFLIFKLPDLGSIPLYAKSRQRAHATAGSRAYNARLDERIDGLRGRGLTVYVVDTWALFEAMVADPRAFGLRDTSTPCLDAKDRPCSRSQQRNRAFFDRIHPNRVVHQHLAEAALAAIAADGAVAIALSAAAPASAAAATTAPVPLPAPAALLLAGVLALGLASRRRYSIGIGRESVPPRAGPGEPRGTSKGEVQ